MISASCAVSSLFLAASASFSLRILKSAFLREGKVLTRRQEGNEPGQLCGHHLRMLQLSILIFIGCVCFHFSFAGDILENFSQR